MNTLLIRRIILVLHVTGIVVMAGTTMIDCLTFNTFWTLADADQRRATGLIPLMARYGTFIRSGAITIILTGIVLLVLDKQVLWSRLWFKIKMILVAALILNGLLIGNRQGHRLRDAVITHADDFLQHTTAIRENMNRFYPVQLTLFFLIILISMLRSDR
ncbi:hypothetical protein [Niabella beijingensis]|uniref:hypothetical protein n=1 Tax=Niabella beijingensis TaxID=2872700 RepID=UPI001CBB2CBF|nr:hypothetical protein [Niabella beijingensis]MBZ4192081.1 hypothetical protein [Niabella beijingensis]